MVLGSLLNRLFPPTVLTAAAPPTADVRVLLPVEYDTIRGATWSRQCEFATGRACARALLARLGAPDSAVPRRADHAPLWPAGFVGSISHTRDLCVAAVARRSDVLSVGIDVERNQDLAPDSWDVILTDGEIAWLEQQPVTSRGRLAAALFSAKECTYKCISPWLLTGFEPRDFQIQWDGVRLAFVSSWLGHADEGATRFSALSGTIHVNDRWILSGMTLPHASIDGAGAP